MSTLRITKKNKHGFKPGDTVSVPYLRSLELIEEGIAERANLPSNVKPRATLAKAAPEPEETEDDEVLEPSPVEDEPAATDPEPAKPAKPRRKKDK